MEPDVQPYEADYTLGADEPVFAGHFPGNPLFPGVLTLALVRETVRRVEGGAWRLGGVARHKLMRPLVPGDRVSVRCKVKAREGRALDLDCRLALADGTAVASARLRLESPGDSDGGSV